MKYKHSSKEIKMPFEEKEVKEKMQEIDYLAQHYFSRIRNPSGSIPRNINLAIKALLLGHFESKWHPIILARCSVRPSRKTLSISIAGKKELQLDWTTHISGSTRWFIDGKGKMQTALRVLCVQADHGRFILEVYSNPVPQFRLEDEARFPNVNATLLSINLNMLNFLDGRNAQVLGWIEWPRNKGGRL